MKLFNMVIFLGLSVVLISDAVWQAMIAAMVTLILAYMQRKTLIAIQDNTAITNKSVAAAEKVVIKVSEVKDDLVVSKQQTDEQLGAISKISVDTHTLVNSNMGVQLKISHVALNRLAVLTKEPEDIAAADIAFKALKEHEAKQAKVDEGDAQESELLGKIEKHTEDTAKNTAKTDAKMDGMRIDKEAADSVTES